MSFIDEAKRRATIKETENGALAYNTTDSACVDLFAVLGGMREYTDEEILNKYKAAREENEELADRMVLYSRDIRGGLGERRTGRILLKELAYLDPQKIIRNLAKIVEVGRWDDLYVLENTPVEDEMWKFIKTTFYDDVKKYNEGKAISLLPKWLKSVNASSEETKRLGRKTAKKLGLGEALYRKMLSKLRAYENVVEVKMSAREFDAIDFETVPSVAMTRYKTAFAKQTEKFNEYIQKVSAGKAKINSNALYPYDLVKDYINSSYINSDREKYPNKVTEEQWKALPNYVQGNHNVIIMADISGSMWGRPLMTSVGLAIYFAERNTGEYQNLYMSFTDRPRYITIKPEYTLREKVSQVIHGEEGYNTNLDGALEEIFNTAIRTKDTPEALVIISDGEIDYFMETEKAEDIVTVWENRYNEYKLEMPKIIFWNVESRNNGTYLGKINNPKVSFCSGQSVSTFQYLTTLIEKSSWEVMYDILMQERYKFN